MNKTFLTVFLSISIIGGILNAFLSSDCTGEFIAWLSSSCFAAFSLLILYAPTK